MSSRSHPARWRSRLFVSLLTAMVLALLGIIVYTYLAYRDAAAQLVMERDRQVTYLSAARLQGELSKFSNSLAALARTPALLGDDPRPRELALSQAAYRLADFDGGVVLLDHFGAVIATEPARSEILRQDWSDREVFRLLLANPGVVFSNVLPEGIEGDQVVAVGVPVLGDGGQFAGAVVGMFRLGEPTVSSLYASIVRMRIGTMGNTYVVDGAGTILYDTSVTLVGLAFADEVMTGLNLNGEPASMRRPDIHGRDVVASFAPIPGTPWTLVSQADWKSLTASTRRYADLLLGAMTVGMLVPALGVMVLVRQRHRARHHHEMGQRDAKLIDDFRQALLPSSLPILYGWELEAHRPSVAPKQPVLEDHLLLQDGRLMISLLHSAEGGVPGAACMISGRAALRAAAQAELDPAEALRSANRLLCLDCNPDHPVHALFGYLDPEQGRFSYALAGMDPPLVHPSDGGPIPRPESGDLGLSLDREPTSGSLTIPGGGTLVISCGLLGRPGSGDGGREPERILDCLERASAEGRSPLDSILAELNHASAVPSEDLLALITLRRDPAPAPREARRP